MTVTKVAWNTILHVSYNKLVRQFTFPFCGVAQVLLLWGPARVNFDKQHGLETAP